MEHIAFFEAMLGSTSLAYSEMVWGLLTASQVSLLVYHKVHLQSCILQSDHVFDISRVLNRKPNPIVACLIGSLLFNREMNGSLPSGKIASEEGDVFMRHQFTVLPPN